MNDDIPVAERRYAERGIVEHAAATAEAVRAINHLTRGGPMPPALVQDVLWHLSDATQQLPLALERIRAALTPDAPIGSAEVYDIEGHDLRYAVTEARVHLTEAAAQAAKLGELLAAAQAAIHNRGHRPL